MIYICCCVVGSCVVNIQADASLEMERKHFYQESMKYVLLLQAVQERKKFEFVEIVSNCTWEHFLVFIVLLLTCCQMITTLPV